jgi:hypothetical protein
MLRVIERQNTCANKYQEAHRPNPEKPLIYQPRGTPHIA